MASYIRNAVAKNLKCPERGFYGYLTKHFLSSKNKFLEEEAVALSQIQPHHRVLEVGFGPGYGLKAAYQKVQGGDGIVCGIDTSVYMVEEAVSHLTKEIDSKKLKILIGNVSRMPFDTDYFDRIFHVNCYYFWPNMRVAIRELYRVLKPGGLTVTTLNLKSLHKAQERGFMQYGHPDPVKYMWALEAYGFEDVRIEYLKHQNQEFQAIFAQVNAKPALVLDEELTDGEELSDDSTLNLPNTNDVGFAKS